ncbi:MAG: DUF882 domain-containing protein [Rhodospirillales bacterium]|nr:DUF882 domain-containing protein [Rhodospirillales bacterium]
MTLDNNENVPVIGRRDVLKSGLIGGTGLVLAGGIFSPVQAASLSKMDRGVREIELYNTHTGEKFSGEYKVGGKYLPDAFEEINSVLRDFRTGEVFPIDPRVLDIMHTIRERLGRKDQFEILSGYRSPKTNKMLRTNTSGVAKNSLHMTGQAVDIRMPGVSTTKIRDIARSLRAGGVGYYPKSGFVHIDTGAVRSW